MTSSTCSICGSNIPETNFALHEATCRRHKYKCSVCSAVIGLEDKEEHDASHVLEKCSLCGSSFPKPVFRKHKEQECPQRRVPCKFCEVDHPLSSLVAHEQTCGSRTEYCDKCGHYIVLRDFVLHSEACQGPPPREESHGLPGGDLESIPCLYCARNIPIAEWTAGHEEACINRLASLLQQQMLQQAAVASSRGSEPAMQFLPTLETNQVGAIAAPQPSFPAEPSSVLPGDFLRMPGDEVYVAPAVDAVPASGAATAAAAAALSDRNSVSSARAMPVDFLRLSPPAAPTGPRFSTRSSIGNGGTASPQRTFSSGSAATGSAGSAAGAPSGGADTELIPCDMCGSMIPFSLYTDHECTRAAVAAAVSPQSPMSRVSMNLSSRRSTRMDSSLSSLSGSEYAQSAADAYDAAARDYSAIAYGSEPVLPARMAEAPPPLAFARAAPTRLSTGGRATEDEALIPCELCGEAFPFSEYAVHEQTCLDRRVGVVRNAILGSMLGIDPSALSPSGVPTAMTTQRRRSSVSQQLQGQQPPGQRQVMGEPVPEPGTGGPSVGIPVDSHIPMGVVAEGSHHRGSLSTPTSPLAALLGLVGPVGVPAVRAPSPPSPQIPTSPPAWAVGPVIPPVQPATAAATTSSNARRASSGTSSASAVSRASPAASTVSERAGPYMRIGTEGDEERAFVPVSGETRPPKPRTPKTVGDKVKGFFQRLFK